MDDQKTLFELYHEPLATEARSRRTDDDTCHEAAQNQNKSGRTGRHRRLVLDALQRCPLATAAELGELTQLGHHEAQRRLSDLHNDGVVEKCTPRLCAVKGTRMVTWRINDGNTMA